MTTTNGQSTNGQCGRTCSECEHAYVGPDGLWCMTYREMIVDERVAQDCVAFDALPPVIQPQPASKGPEFVAACDAYLRSRRCTLFGQVFEVISPEGRAQAAEWLAQQVAAVTAGVSAP